MSRQTSRNPLFEPFTCKTLELPNRIVMADDPVEEPGGIPGTDIAANCRRRAEGGVG
jgi:2,4-dienoyl-CoA reductase-like NADH-dependent reductase (Old Yellow Enzyme family)